MNNTKILEATVKELQGQLQTAYSRIAVLTDELNKNIETKLTIILIKR